MRLVIKLKIPNSVWKKSHTFTGLANVDPLYLAYNNQHDMLDDFRFLNANFSLS